jgi:2'-5' RNA ligase
VAERPYSHHAAILDMKLAIVAYPALDEGDRHWIEAIRQRYDPQASRIAVHFTLVFPLDGLAADITSELEAVARATEPIQFAIGQTTAVPDVLSRVIHVFLVPGDGHTQIATLHDSLYAGQLHAHLRSDIAYIPHVTVGVVEDSAAAERLATEIGGRARTVRGRIDRLDLIDIGGGQVRTISSYLLGGVGPSD